MGESTYIHTIHTYFKSTILSSFAVFSVSLQVLSDLFLLAGVRDLAGPVQDLLLDKAFIEMDRDEDGGVTLVSISHTGRCLCLSSQEEFTAACLGEKRFSKMLTVKLIDIFIE